MKLKLLAFAAAIALYASMHIEIPAPAVPPASVAPPSVATAPPHKCRAADALSTQKGCATMTGVTALK